MSNFYIYFLLLIFEFVNSEVYVPKAEIPQGKLNGVLIKSKVGVDHEAFLGIPYAKAPVGNLRFKDSEKADPWLGTYNASNYGSDCIQYAHAHYDIIGEEDCLFINVYRPIAKGKKLQNLDVIVHIHGGAFLFSAGKHYRPDILMHQDLVYVNFNYRLAPLGFLSLGDEVLPGNLGLKDQSFALKWIKDNVKYFGGNPESITITGLSAGGVSVHYHYLSPRSQGLFKGGVSMSGAVLNPWALAENVPEKTKQLAKYVGCPIHDSKTIVDCLRTRPAKQLVAQIPKFQAWLYNPYSPFGPVVEPEGVPNPFLPKDPYDMLKNGEFAKVPWLTSFTTEEGLYPASEFVDNKKRMKHLEKNWVELLPHILDYNYTIPDEKRFELAETIKKYYLKDRRISESPKEVVQLVGDRLFNAGILQSAWIQAELTTSNAPVYFYEFAYRGKESVSDFFSKGTTDLGVCHADDTCYVLETDYINTDGTESDRKMRLRLAHLWISFAKTGIPEFFENKPLPIVKGSDPNIQYTSIRSSEEAITKKTTNKQHFDFWSSLPLKEYLKVPSDLKGHHNEL